MAEGSNTEPQTFNDSDAIAREIVERTRGRIRLALPLGLGKANTIVNALTRAAMADHSIELSILTALTLERPSLESDMERRFLEPAAERLFGRYPALLYAQGLRDGALPGNIEVSEFFLLAGRWLGIDRVQQNYISANYTHALGYILARRPNVVAQLLARDGRERFSLSCNADISPDLLKARADGRADFIFAGEVNSELPFMGGPGLIAPSEIDFLLDDPRSDFELFSAVKRPVGLADHAIGLHVSRLVRDGGTLQIGIGLIGDAVAHALILRHRDNAAYREIFAKRTDVSLPDDTGDDGLFETGLYAVTEMLVDGLLQLFRAGIVRREVEGAAIHAGFFVGPRAFYAALRDMPADQLRKVAMMPVSFTNELYGEEEAKRAARVHARFVNNAMKATLIGAVVSDCRADGQVVSGVGGQYNFVAQAFALEGARAIMALNATRTSEGRTVSNIVWDDPHTTIPRHLRDIVVTEYGIADLRGKSDAEVIAAMLSIADSRFQEMLVDRAKSAGKLSAKHRIADAYRRNTPDHLATWLSPFCQKGVLPSFPFGTDFTEAEQRLLPALACLKQTSASNRALARLMWQGMSSGPPQAEHQACLERMGLAAPKTIKERVSALLLRAALARTDREAQ